MITTSLSLVETVPLESSFSYQLRALAGAASVSPLGSTSQVMSGPRAPGSPTTTPASGGFQVQWIDQSGIETGYRVERQAGSGAFERLADLPPGTTVFGDPSLLPGGPYRYRVTALSPVTTSSYAAQAPDANIAFAGAPTISSVSRDLLLATGGEDVVVTGTNFGVGVVVKIGGVTMVGSATSTTSLVLSTEAHAGSVSTPLDLEVASAAGVGVLGSVLTFVEDYVREDFGALPWDSRLEDPTGAFTVSGGKLRRKPAVPNPTVPSFFRTKRSDYLLRELVNGVTITLPATACKVYVGVGEGSPDASVGNAPGRSLAWEIGWNGTSGTLFHLVSEDGGRIHRSVLGSVGAATLRLRLTATQSTIALRHDFNYSGTFSQDGAGFYLRSQALPKLQHDKTHFFLGTDSADVSFDDLRIEDRLRVSPTLTRVEPTHGSQAGGETLTLRGLGFGAPGSPISVFFDGVPAAATSVVDPTTLTCTAPAHGAGSVPVRVANASGDQTWAGYYTYFGPSFFAGFDSLDYDANLVLSKSEWTLSSGGLRFVAASSTKFARTQFDDYGQRVSSCDIGFGFAGGTGTTYGYFGLGAATASPGDPPNAVYLKVNLASPYDLQIVSDVGGAQTTQALGFIGPGNHRVRFERAAGGGLTFSLDRDSVGGAFVADFTGSVPSPPPFIAVGPTYGFFAARGNGGPYLDNFKVDAP